MQLVELRFLVEFQNFVETTQRPGMNPLVQSVVNLDVINCHDCLASSQRCVEDLANVFASILNDLIEVALEHDEPLFLYEGQELKAVARGKVTYVE